MYEIVGAIEKNKDTLSQNLLFVMKSKFSPLWLKCHTLFLSPSLNTVLCTMPPATGELKYLLHSKAQNNKEWILPQCTLATI